MTHRTINPPVLGGLEYKSGLLVVPIRLLDLSISTRTCAENKDCKSHTIVLLHLNAYHNTGGCKVQVVGHFFTLTETTETIAKMRTLGLNIIFRALC